MRKALSAIWPVLFIFLLTLFFFAPIFKGQIPFPGDTLIGGYYPWRALSWQGRTTEYPLKQMSIADASSQFYPWRYLAVKLMKQGRPPLWNSYEFSGTPLLGIPSSAALYPLNFLFFIFPFNLAWTILVIMQPFLAGTFFYLFLKNKNLSKIASLLGAVCFSFGSYFLLSTELSVLGHTALWFPLALLAVDKLFKKPRFLWFLILTFSLTMSLLAGFVQFVFYGYVLIFLYSVFCFFTNRKEKKISFLMVIGCLVFALLLSSVQILPFFDLLKEFGRIEVYGKMKVITRFFIPYRQLAMFFAPDYFGNPGTKNYWGEINYYEFCGYFGVTALFLILYLLYSHKKKREAFFWLAIGLISLFFALENPLSAAPYNLKIPILSSLLPARLLFVVSISASVLAAFGLERLIKDYRKKNKKEVMLKLLASFFSLAFVAVVLLINLFSQRFLKQGVFINKKQIIALRNLVLPTFYLFLGGAILVLSNFVSDRKRRFLYFLIIIIVSLDLCRQGRKFLPFIDHRLVYPDIKTTEFLKQNIGINRFAPLHQEIFGTNQQTVYGLESIEGYNPLHSRDYSVFISQGQKDYPAKSLSTHFERTVYGRNHQANIYKLLSVKYFLSFENFESEDYPLVFTEGETKIYENKKALPRVFLACNWEKEKRPLQIINNLIAQENPAEKVFLEKEVEVNCGPTEELGSVEVVDYISGEVRVKSRTPAGRILVFSDIYYPGWRVFIDENEGELLKVNYVLKGVVVPAGEHTVRFIYDPLSFKIGTAISLIALVVLGGLFVYETKNRRRTPPKRSP